MGADDLIANGQDVAVINYHDGGNDPFQNVYSNSRVSYYGMQGSPTAWFDGGNTVVGGNHTNSMYSTYLPKYNQRINIPCYFALDMEGISSGMIDYELSFTIEKESGAPTENLVLHVAVTESDIAYNWQGMNEVNQVERLMAPDQFGTPLDFSGGDILELNVYFSMDQSWENENCDVVAFIQNTESKEIMQGTIKPLSDFGGISDIDASIKKIYVPQTVCSESFVPKIILGNNGSTDLTSIELYASVNGNVVSSLSWSGNLAYGESELVTLPEASFTLEANNFVTLEALSPNGQADQVPFNNINGQVLEDAPNVTSPVNLALKLDDNPEETTWELKDSQGNVLYSGGPYTQAGQFVVQQFELNDVDCYTFMIFDEGGDGLLGTGLYKLAWDGSTIFGEGKDFGYEDQIQFGIGLTGTDDVFSSTDFEIFPNPVRENAMIQFTIDKPGVVEYKIYNYMGSMVKESNKQHFSEGNHMIALSTEELTQGVYIIEFRTTDHMFSEQIIISK